MNIPSGFSEALHFLPLGIREAAQNLYMEQVKSSSRNQDEAQPDQSHDFLQHTIAVVMLALRHQEQVLASYQRKTTVSYSPPYGEAVQFQLSPFLPSKYREESKETGDRRGNVDEVMFFQSFREFVYPIELSEIEHQTIVEVFEYCRKQIEILGRYQAQSVLQNVMLRIELICQEYRTPPPPGLSAPLYIEHVFSESPSFDEVELQVPYYNIFQLVDWALKAKTFKELDKFFNTCNELIAKTHPDKSVLQPIIQQEAALMHRFSLARKNKEINVFFSHEDFEPWAGLVVSAFQNTSPEWRTDD